MCYRELSTARSTLCTRYIQLAAPLPPPPPLRRQELLQAPPCGQNVSGYAGILFGVVAAAGSVCRASRRLVGSEARHQPREARSWTLEAIACRLPSIAIIDIL